MSDRLRQNAGLPLAPPTTAHVSRVPGCLDGLRAGLLSLAGLGAVLLTAMLDYMTGPELSLSIFYLIPVAGCAWWGGFAHGILLSLAGALAWHVVDVAEHAHLHVSIALWNGIVRFGTFVIVSSLVARLHLGILRERRLARTDVLTGAANGRTYYEAVGLEAERAARTGHPLTLAYLDLDNFKQLNDRLGHAAGDAALIDLVRVVEPGLRTADVLARLGGDEFALLLPDTDAEGAIALLTRIQTVVAYETARCGRPITISVGAVTFVEPLWDVDLMVQQVDNLMYAAKRRGKNRVEHAVIRDVRDLRELRSGGSPRVERRATARTVCNHAARVRPEGADEEELFATVYDLSPHGIGLRLNRTYPTGSVLIVEPLACAAKTLLARVIRIEPVDETGHRLHGCMLSTQLTDEELQTWLTGHLLVART